MRVHMYVYLFYHIYAFTGKYRILKNKDLTHAQSASSRNIRFFS